MKFYYSVGLALKHPIFSTACFSMPTQTPLKLLYFKEAQFLQVQMNIYIITHTKLICNSTSKWNHKSVLKPNKFYLFNERPVQQPNKSQELLMAAIGKTTVWEILSFIVLFSGKFLSVIINYIKMRDRLQRKSGLC